MVLFLRFLALFSLAKFKCRFTIVVKFLFTTCSFFSVVLIEMMKYQLRSWQNLLKLVFSTGKPRSHFNCLWNFCTGGFIAPFPYIHIFYPGLVHKLHYSHSSLSSLFEMTLQVFSVSHSYTYRKYMDHVHPPLPSHSGYSPLLNLTCFIFLSFIF
jgi:hypothetical protein